jgi:hypothetical protein
VLWIVALVRGVLVRGVLVRGVLVRGTLVVALVGGVLIRGGGGAMFRALVSKGAWFVFLSWLPRPWLCD